ncbi:hypothetical protein ACMD2_24151, partial [Ananas comosus]
MVAVSHPPFPPPPPPRGDLDEELIVVEILLYSWYAVQLQRRLCPSGQRNFVFVAGNIQKKSHCPKSHLGLEICIERHTLIEFCMATQMNCVDYVRMDTWTFFSLADITRDHNLLKDTFYVTIEEQLTMFLHTLGHYTKNRILKIKFIRSGETISQSICPTSRPETHPEIALSPLYLPYFKTSQSINAQETVMSIVPLSAPHKEASKKQEISKRKSTSLSEKVEQAKSGLKVDKGFKKTAYIAAASTREGCGMFFLSFSSLSLAGGLVRSGGHEPFERVGVAIAPLEAGRARVSSPPLLAEHLEAHPKAANVLNKPIKHYDALKIICGDDQATGQFCLTIYDNYINGSADRVNIEARDETTPDDDSIEKRGLRQDGDAFTPTNNNSATPSFGKSRGKKPHEANEEHFDDLIATVKEVAVAIKISVTAHWSDNSWPRITETGDYAKWFIAITFITIINTIKEREHRRAWTVAIVAKGRVMGWNGNDSRW